jgi:hypothetical protein
MIFFSMAVFSLLSNRVLNYKEQTTVEDQVETNSREMEFYLSKIDKIMPNRKISEKIYDEALLYMEHSHRFSIYRLFHDVRFFKMMPPRLKHKIFMQTLREERHKMSYFFHDKMRNIKADQGFIRKIICGLNCSFYQSNAMIAEKNKEMEAVYFIFLGDCYLKSLYEIEGIEYGF